MAALGELSEYAVIFGRHRDDKPMRKTRSIAIDNEGDVTRPQSRHQIDL